MFYPKEVEDLPIIIIDNFLPKNYLEKLFNDILKLKKHFNNSKFVDNESYSQKEHCNGDDIWLPFPPNQSEKNADVGESIFELQNYFFHEGVIDFIDNCKNSELNCYSRFPYNFAFHIINYGDGGYYNWHLDHKVFNPLILMGKAEPSDIIPLEKNVTFTFALTIIKDESKLTGGKQVFMKNGKVLEIESKNNQLVIFPSNVYHSLTEIKAEKNLPWENRRFNFQAWLCHI